MIVDKILNMTLVFGGDDKRILTLKDRDGPLKPRYVEGLGLTGEGYGSQDCTSDLNLDELKALAVHLNYKIFEASKS